MNRAQRRERVAERESFIGAACADDIALRGELCSLLRSHELAGGPLDAEPVLCSVRWLTIKFTNSIWFRRRSIFDRSDF